MGGDGGSLPARADMVRTSGMKFVRNLGGMGYSPNTQVKDYSKMPLSERERKALSLTTCAITQQKLKSPIVACGLGQLYNREAILTALLAKSMPVHAQHIQSSNDVKTCNVTFNRKTGFMICPISMTDIEGRGRCIMIWTCGCVLSEKAFRAVDQKSQMDQYRKHKSIPNTEKEPAFCVNCSQTYDPQLDIITIAPSLEELEELKRNLPLRRKSQKLTKAKKRKRLTNSEDTIDLKSQSQSNKGTNSSAEPCPSVFLEDTDTSVHSKQRKVDQSLVSRRQLDDSKNVSEKCIPPIGCP